MVQYGDSTAYFSRIGDRHLKYSGNLRSARVSLGWRLNMTVCAQGAGCSERVRVLRYTVSKQYGNESDARGGARGECVRVQTFRASTLRLSCTSALFQ
jgi:hypothetical protein